MMKGEQQSKLISFDVGDIKNVHAVMFATNTKAFTR